jgi:hypothetical protein
LRARSPTATATFGIEPPSAFPQFLPGALADIGAADGGDAKLLPLVVVEAKPSGQIVGR